MARTLSDTLKAQQKLGMISWPYVAARITRKWGDVIRFDFEKAYGGLAGDTDTDKLIGANDLSVDGECTLNRFYLVRFQAEETGFVSGIRFLLALGCGVKVALYADSEGEPGALLSANDTGKVCATGWNGISIPHYEVTKDTYYWLAFNTDADRLEYHTASGTVRWLGANFAGFSFPNPAGEGFNTLDTFYPLISGWNVGFEDDYLHCAAMPSDGSLIRLRVSNVADSNKLYYQRVATPALNSDFSAWDYLSLYDVIAVASCAYGAYVAQFYINGDREIHFRESTDSGANWGGWSLIDYVPSGYDVYADAAYKSNYDITLVYTDQSTLYQKQRLTDVWEDEATNPNALANKTGVSIYYHEDWNVIVTSGATDEVKTLSACIFGDGERQASATWSSWETIVERGTTEPFIFRSPFVRRPDTTRLYFVESFTQEETLNHIWYSHMPPSAHFDDIAWLEPVPLEPQSEYGLAFTQLGSYAWLTNANRVFRALATQEELVLTARLLEIDSRDYPDIYKGSLKVVLDNTGGWYDAFDRLGQQLEVAIGYRTPVGNEYSFVPFRWITKFKLIAPPWYPLRMIYPQGVQGTLLIETEDAWTFLYRYRTRRTLSWAAGEKSVKELLHFFIARCGLDFEVISQSAAASNFKPAFDVRTGTSYRTAIKNLLKMVPDQLVFRDAKVMLKSPGGPTVKHIQTLMPSGAGNETVISFQFPDSGAHWEKVDEETPDEDETYVHTANGVYQRDLYALPNPSHEGTISSIEVFYRVRNTQDTFDVGAKASIRTHDITYDGEEYLTKSTSYETFSEVWEKNPFTGEAWTWDEMDALEAGVSLWGGGAAEYLRCTQVKVEVNYWLPITVDWTYHTTFGTGLLVYRGSYGQTALDPNRVEVWGDTLMKQAADWPQVGMVRDRLKRVTTPDYPDITSAGERADAEIRKSEILTGAESWLNAPMNCGLEPWDVLQITDVNAGVNAIKRRVIRIKAYWNARHWSYHQVVTLGAD